MEAVGNYALRTTTDMPFEEAIEQVTAWLAEEGFGILTEIDVTATLKKKLDADFKPYRILGACNPPLAKEVLTAEPHMGVMLPCNVVVWDEGDHRVVTTMNTAMMGQMNDEKVIQEAAGTVREKLERVLRRFE